MIIDLLSTIKQIIVDLFKIIIHGYSSLFTKHDSCISKAYYTDDELDMIKFQTNIENKPRSIFHEPSDIDSKLDMIKDVITITGLPKEEAVKMLIKHKNDTAKHFKRYYLTSREMKRIYKEPKTTNVDILQSTQNASGEVLP